MGESRLSSPKPQVRIYFQASPCISYTVGKRDGSGAGDGSHDLGKKETKEHTSQCSVRLLLLCVNS